MQKNGLFVKLVAKPGKEEALTAFLRNAVSLAQQEAGTRQWYAFQLNEKTFGIFDTFDNEKDRAAHLNGKIASALMAQAPDLVEGDLAIDKLEILAQK